MSEANINRRLAAILAADVVGYSRLMGQDESGTHAALKKHRESLFDPAVQRNNGRIFKLMGDGTLVEFSSVIDAVKCALEIQRAVAAESEADPAGPRIILRIGINLGDVIIEGEDLYGDGVNVAARMEPLAEPGGICVAAIVNESIGRRLDVTFSDGGEVQVKNIHRPIRIWKWKPDDPTAGLSQPVLAAAPTQNHAPANNNGAARQTASVAVLPFDNMSGDPEQEYFSDGISEDIITDLSKIAGLLVIARNSSFTYKGKSVDLRQVGRELGVRSVVEGSIRRAGNRVRITAQLIDAATGGHVWAERYDRELTDIFEVQDDVTRNIVAALKVALTPAEEARMSNTTATSSTEAHDLFLRGRELMTASLNNAVAFREAKSLFNRAIELDENYSEPHAGLAMAYCFDHLNNWSDASGKSLERAAEAAKKAVALDPEDPYAHYAMSLALGIGGDSEAASVETETSLRLNPNFAPGYNSRGVFKLFHGHPAEAIPSIEKAIRLDPGSGQQYLHFLGIAHLMLRNYETAAATFRERILQFPGTDLSRSFLTATLGHLGQTEEAKKVWKDLKLLNPKYDFDRHMANLAFKQESVKEHFAEGLRKAGVLK
jgi:adenylate cyclase